MEQKSAQTLALALAIIAMVTALPLVVLFVQDRTLTLDQLPLWSLALLALAVTQVAWACYLWQFPDWSSLWALAIGSAAVAVLCAVAFGWLMRTTVASEQALVWGLEPYLRNGRAATASFLLLCLNGTWSYLAGQRAARGKSQSAS